MKFWRILAFSCLVILALPFTVPGTRGVVSPSSYQILLQDDFSQGLGKWHSVQGDWAVQSGELRGTSNKGEGLISSGAISWTDYVFSARIKSLTNTNSSDDLLVRFQDSSNYYRIALLRDHIEFWSRRQGSDQLLYREEPSYPLNMTDWHDLRIKIYGPVPTITAYIDDYPEITIKDVSGQPISNGMVGLAVSQGASSAFGTIKVTTLHPDSTGVQRIILLLVEFPDVKHTTTPDQMYQNVLLKLNQYYTEVSYNQTWIVGTVTPSWKMLQNKSTYYDLAQVTGSGFRNGRDIQFLKDAILAWDNEVDYSRYDYVFVAGAGSSVWGYTYFQEPIVTTNEGVTITAATAQNENQLWDVYAHEFGHLSLGLPDLYSYAIAFTDPADFRVAAIYVGPWDLMSRANLRPQIGAWGKIHVGWIPENRIREVYSNQQGAATLNPLENPTSGTQAITIYLTPTTYFVVEDRQQVGFDSVLPDKGILISYVNEAKYWLRNGPVIVQDANPTSGPRWQLLHPTFDIGNQAKSLYTNQTFNLAVDLLDRFPNGSYVVAFGKPDSMDMAEAAYKNLNEAKAAIQNASASGKMQGSAQAQVTLGQAWQRFLSGDFQLARSLANQSETTSEQTNSTFTFNQMPLPPITSSTTSAMNSTTNSTTRSNTNYRPIIAVSAAVAIAVIAIWVIRSRRMKPSNENGPSKTASTTVEQKGGS